MHRADSIRHRHPPVEAADPASDASDRMVSGWTLPAHVLPLSSGHLRFHEFQLDAQTERLRVASDGRLADHAAPASIREITVGPRRIVAPFRPAWTAPDPSLAEHVGG